MYFRIWRWWEGQDKERSSITRRGEFFCRWVGSDQIWQQSDSTSRSKRKKAANDNKRKNQKEWDNSPPLPRLIPVKLSSVTDTGLHTRLGRKWLWIDREMRRVNRAAHLLIYFHFFFWKVLYCFSKFENRNSKEEKNGRLCVTCKKLRSYSGLFDSLLLW